MKDNYDHFHTLTANAVVSCYCSIAQLNRKPTTILGVPLFVNPIGSGINELKRSSKMLMLNLDKKHRWTDKRKKNMRYKQHEEAASPGFVKGNET